MVELLCDNIEAARRRAKERGSGAATGQSARAGGKYQTY